MQYLSKEQVEKVLAEVKAGQFVTVVYHKESNDELRAFRGRIGVAINLTGGPNTNNNDKNQTLYDDDKKAYRSFNKSRVIAINAAGQQLACQVD